MSVHAQRKIRWHTFLGFGPASLSYRANAASCPLNLGSKPSDNIKQWCSWRNYTINFEQKLNDNFDKFLQQFPSCLVWNVVFWSIWKNQEALTSLFNCSLNSSHSLSKIFLYFWNSSATVQKKMSPAMWKFSAKMMSSHYRFKMATM